MSLLHNVTVGTTATRLCGPDMRRLGVVIQSLNTDIFVSFTGDSGLSASNGMKILAGSPPFGFGFAMNGAPYEVLALTASGTATVQVEEMT